MRLTAIVAGLLLLLAPAASVAATADAGGAADVTLRVTVVNANGDGLGNAEVTITYGDESDTRETVSNGEVLFDVPQGSDVTIEVSHPSLVRNHPKTLSNVQGDTDETVTMYKKSTATLTVEDGDGTVSGAVVTLQKSGQSVPAAQSKTGDNGVFTATDLEAGDYTVWVQKAGYLDRRTTLTLDGETNQTIDVEQGRVSVEFNVVDPRIDGKPLQALVEVADDSGTAGSVRTDANGGGALTLDVNTKYTITVTKDGYETRTQELNVREDDRTLTYEISRTPELTVEPDNDQVVVGQTVRVTVTNEYGDVVEGAEVTAGSSSATTDADGEAAVTIESAGDVQLVAKNGSVTADGVTVEGIEAGSGDGGDEETSETTTTAQSTTAPTTDTVQSTTETATDESEDSGGSPGFGVGVALVALLGAALVALRRD
ncbi:carboxypeptidase regulatory-like domain-containing protein [Haloarchaeobius sp. DFWS5]|uniref:carboxypeptidase regulatory-like domain-containing protein n=1 Tax=Haloarchaeobius sp. DFWS5 TaxID=3446114 RepID=UPI003EB75733